MAAPCCSVACSPARLRAPVQQRVQRRQRCVRAQAAGAQREAAAAQAAAAAAADAAAAAAVEAAEEPAEDEDEYLALPEAQHYMTVPAFRQEEVVRPLRDHFDERLGNPLSKSSDRFCWDWWHVPGQYTLLRTPARAFFPPALYDKLEDALVEFGESQLGCRGISPIWLSCYVSGCRQGLHADAPHGPFAFVLSLTRWDERRFSGGETLLLQPRVLDYWRGFDSGVGTEMLQLTTLIEPRFGQLTVFDGRIPHGVQQVEGVLDPLQGRIVAHGWFTEPSPFFSGSLSEEDATPALNACLGELYEALAVLSPVVGVVTLRLDIAGDSGRVADIQWLANTLVARPQGGGDPADATQDALAAIAEHCFRARFPPSGDGGATAITLPFVFE